MVSVAVGVLLPLWIILVLSTITVQGILSRQRVQKILATKVKNSSNHIGINVRAASMEEDAVETAMNIGNLISSPITPRLPSNPNYPCIYCDEKSVSNKGERNHKSFRRRN